MVIRGIVIFASIRMPRVRGALGGSVGEVYLKIYRGGGVLFKKVTGGCSVATL